MLTLGHNAYKASHLQRLLPVAQEALSFDELEAKITKHASSALSSEDCDVSVLSQ